MKESVNIYTSTCCGVPATKPPCIKPKAQAKAKKGKGREKAPEFSTLGSWRCGNCNKPCTVTVSPRPPKQEAANAGPQED